MLTIDDHSLDSHLVRLNFPADLGQVLLLTFKKGVVHLQRQFFKLADKQPTHEEDELPPN